MNEFEKSIILNPESEEKEKAKRQRKGESKKKSKKELLIEKYAVRDQIKKKYDCVEEEIMKLESAYLENLIEVISLEDLEKLIKERTEK